jgi:small-conductance mechanosensitive channel
MRPLYCLYVTILCLSISWCVVTLTVRVENGLAQPPQSSAPLVTPLDSLTQAQASEALASAQNDLKAIPADVPDAHPEGRRRAALRRRITLLEEYVAVLAKAESILGQKTDLESRLQHARRHLASLDQAAAPQGPGAPNKQDFEKLTATVAEQRGQVSTLRKTIGERNQWMEKVPQLIASTRERADEAAKRAGRLAEERAIEQTEAEKKLVAIQIDNARFEKGVALKTIEVVQAEAELEKALEPVRTAELELAEKQLERLDQEFTLYSQALEQQLSLEQRRQEEELARKQQEAVTARTPAERFIAEWEAELLHSRRNKGALEAFLVGLKRDVVEAEKRLIAEKEELTGLREFLKRKGVSGRAADRIKLLLRQIKLRRRLLERPIRPNFLQTLNAYRERRFEIEDTLFALAERWNEQRLAILSQLPEADQAAFKSRTADLLASYRTTLRDEKGFLTEAITLGQQAQFISIQRQDTLNELERFLRSRAFWLRDGKPLGITTIRFMGKEFRKLADWYQQLGSEDVTTQLAGILRRPMSIVYGLLLVVALPAFLMYVRHRLRRVTQSRNQLSLDQTSSFRNRAMAILTGILSAALIPLYLLLAAKFLGAADLPPILRPVLSQVLDQMAYVLFFWLLTRLFCRDQGILRAQFDMHPEAVRVLYGSLRLILLSSITWLLLWRVLSHPPFILESLPRLSYTLFAILLAVAIIRLMRLKSPFIQHCIMADTDNIVSQHWPLISTLFMLVIGVIIALDVAGFRYAARGITHSLVLSLVTLVVLPLIYRGTTAAIQSMARQRRHAAVTAAPGEEATPTETVEQQVQRFVRVVFILLVIFLLAGYWGIDQQALKTLDEIRIYGVRGVGDLEEFVTTADVVRALLFLVITFWLLRGLPGIYEFAVLPRLRLDEGMKYAVLTLARYCIFMVGILLTLSELHLDLGRLGWLMAAVGVGLGFGLQEIVSNFVSGIILLVERPIQVNDLVTVGNMSGTVRRINIRATTIVNFDRQEVILPNRRLITSEVTNWTRGDTINRLVISIGAAYGSNVDEVSEILLQIARDQEEVLKDPAPSVIFMQHGESALEFLLRVFIPSPSVLMPVRDRINKAINKAFAERGITIPFPQRDLHIKSSVVNGDDLARLGHRDAPATSQPPDHLE